MEGTVPVLKGSLLSIKTLRKRGVHSYTVRTGPDGEAAYLLPWFQEE